VIPVAVADITGTSFWFFDPAGYPWYWDLAQLVTPLQTATLQYYVSANCTGRRTCP
jgi:hypothetical protein